MINSSADCISKFFSHIYIEKDCYKYKNTDLILKMFPNSEKIVVNKYTDIFNRPRQDFQLQKKSPQLILAVKKEPFLYKGPEICEDYGHKRFFYTSSIINCIYDCKYCFLQGMYPSANAVIFVNIEDYFNAVDKELKNGALYICTSYDTDLLAFQNIIPYAENWIDYASKHDDLIAEIRTKSSNFKFISHIKPSKSVILAWTLTPAFVAENYEIGAPAFDARLGSALNAINSGWKIRLCLEPILYIENYKSIYGEFIDHIFDILPSSGIRDINIGMFRINKEYFKKLIKNRTDTDLYSNNFIYNDNVVSYKKEVSDEMTNFIYNKVTSYYDKEKVFI